MSLEPLPDLPPALFQIRVCQHVHCRRNRSLDVLDAMRRALGVDVDQATPDGVFALGVAHCFGECQRGPNVRVNDQVHTGVTVAKVEGMLRYARLMARKRQAGAARE